MADEVVKVSEETKNQVALMQEKEWFNTFIDAAQGIVVKISDFSWDIIVKYHALGKLLLDYEIKFKEDGRTIGEMEAIVSEQVNRSTRTIRRAKQFYQTYPDLEKAPYTSGAQWTQILNDLKKK